MAGRRVAISRPAHDPYAWNRVRNRPTLFLLLLSDESNQIVEKEKKKKDYLQDRLERESVQHVKASTSSRAGPPPDVI